MFDAFIKMMNEEWRILFFTIDFYLFHQDWIYSMLVIGEIKHQSVRSYQWVCNSDRWLAWTSQRKKFTADGLSVLVCPLTLNLIDRTTTQQIHLRGEEARKTIEDMHAVWTMENEEAHDERRESESRWGREPSTHCLGRWWGCDPLEICLRTVAPIEPSTASTSMCRCDHFQPHYSY